MKSLHKYIIIVLLITYSCKHDSPLEDIDKDLISNPTISDKCDIDTVYFVNTIKPLINNSCATTNCHDAITAKDGIVLDTYTNIIISGEVKSHKPFDSKLFEVLTDDGDDLMPPNNPLSAEQIDSIKKWIYQGALNNQCIDDCKTKNLSFSNDIWPTINNNCTSCHGGSGGVNLENYNDVKTLVDNSKLLNTLHATNGAPLMPPSEKLEKCKLDQIEQWINEGALNN